MQIKRLLDNNRVSIVYRPINSMVANYELVRHAHGKLTATLACVLCLLKIKPAGNRE